MVAASVGCDIVGWSSQWMEFFIASVDLFLFVAWFVMDGVMLSFGSG